MNTLVGRKKQVKEKNSSSWAPAIRVMGCHLWHKWRNSGKSKFVEENMGRVLILVHGSLGHESGVWNKFKTGDVSVALARERVVFKGMGVDERVATKGQGWSHLWPSRTADIWRSEKGTPWGWRKPRATHEIQEKAEVHEAEGCTARNAAEGSNQVRGEKVDEFHYFIGGVLNHRICRWTGCGTQIPHPPPCHSSLLPPSLPPS